MAKVDIKGPGTPRIKTIPQRAWFLESAIAIFVLFVPIIGASWAIYLCFERLPTVLDWSLFFVGYVLTMLGVTMGLHRFFSHRSFISAGPKTTAVLAILASSAMQGPIIRWAADHRRHHQYADTSLDPHSPISHEKEGLAGLLYGLWWAHVGWFFSREKTVARTYAPDLLRDPIVSMIDRTYFFWALSSIALPGVIGFALTQSVQAAVSATVFGGLLRVFATQHAIWAVNSLCHVVGNRAYPTKDGSRNLWWMSIPTLGEGWHNTHHAYPNSPRVGLERRQLDVTWIVIALLQEIGLVRIRESSIPCGHLLARIEDIGSKS